MSYPISSTFIQEYGEYTFFVYQNSEGSLNGVE